MSTATIPSVQQRPATEPIPSTEPVLPLENGDRLTRPEFERRYNAMPNVKAELIEGVVYMGSPVGYQRHGFPHLRVATWIGRYLDATLGVEGATDASVRIDLDNMAQPDAFLIIPRRLGGGARIDDDDYVDGIPELVVEVASSSVSYDLHSKLNVYRRLGIPEYVVWRTRDRAVDWFVLENGSYVRLPLDPDGLYRSRVFPGLWLDPKALLEDDRATMVRVSQEGSASAEHLAFVEKLTLAANPKPTEG
jgi:Uma2 family endonuclease